MGFGGRLVLLQDILTLGDDRVLAPHLGRDPLVHLVVAQVPGLDQWWVLLLVVQCIDGERDDGHDHEADDEDRGVLGVLGLRDG